MDFELFRSRLNTIYDTDEVLAIFNSLTRDEIVIDENIICRLENHEPMQYILEYAWFYGRKIVISPATLIPRPETEELCHLILADLNETPIKIADIGTGSGCIAVTLALENNAIEGMAVDISEAALDIAKKNIVYYNLEKRIQCVQSDFLLDPLPMRDFDVLVSNPPYIAQHELATMEAKVTEWEPHIALFPKGEDPLIFYKQLLKLLMIQNNKDCVLWAEINGNYAKALLQIFKPYCICKIIKDMSGNPRFLYAKKEGF